MGWTSLKNGELLRRASASFDLIVTADQNLQYQQNLSRLPFSVIVLVARSNRIEQLRPLLLRLPDVLASLRPRTLIRLEAWGRSQGA